MKYCYKLAAPLGAIVLSLLLPAAIAASNSQSADATAIRIELNDGLLSAEIHDAPLPQVLTEIGKLAGFKVVRVADFDDFPRIDHEFEKLPLQQAVTRLLAGTNSITFFSPREDAESGRSISQLWLLGPGKTGVDTTQHSEVASGLQHEEPLIRSQAVLHMVQQEGEEAVLEKLTHLLQTDEDPLVRSRVATALGSLADERAIPELEFALQDSDFSVRAQSIAALGRIGGERATMALGGILTNVNVASLERVMAAQALWKQDTELAQGFLQAGRAAGDEQVREASSTAPSVPAITADGPQAGSEITE